MTNTISTRNKHNRERGRAAEYRLAKKVHGVRVGRSKAVKLPNGKFLQVNCQKPPDVVTELFSFESKWLSKVPANISKVMNQAVANAPTNLIPVGVIGDRLGGVVYYVMMERDFISLHIGEEE